MADAAGIEGKSEGRTAEGLAVRRPGSVLRRFIRRKALGAAGGLIVLVMLLMAVFAELLATQTLSGPILRRRCTLPRPLTGWEPTTWGGTSTAGSSTGRGSPWRWGSPRRCSDRSWAVWWASSAGTWAG